MAEINTVARPYAEALFRVAKKEDLKAWGEVVATLAQIADDPRMRAVVGDPRLSSEQIYSVIAGVFKQPLSAEGENFVKTLLANDRFLVMPEIATQFHDLKNAAEGRADAVIYSAFALDDAQTKALVASLEKRFARKITPAVIVDQSLIGGVRVVVGDQVLDSSVRARLNEMRYALTA